MLAASIAQGSISVSSSSFSNSGAKRSMIRCGSAQRRAVGDEAELHAAAYETMLTPTPTSPDEGTQKMLCRSVLPQNT